MVGGGVAEGSNREVKYSLRIAWSMARWVEDARGREALADLAALAGVKVEDFDGTTCWIDGTQLETILAECRRLAGDDETFQKAMVHRFKESYGAFQHMIWSMSLESMSRLSVKMGNKVLMQNARMELVAASRTSFRFRYIAPTDTELMCLSRKAVWAHTPTLHGLPPGELIEHKS